jgi:serine/threonine protein kinase
MHVDSNDEEKLLIYPYYQNTLLRLLQEDPEVSDAARKRILRQTAEAIQELHSKDWIHIGTASGPDWIFHHGILIDNRIAQISSPIIYWSTGLAMKRVPRQSPMSLWVTSTLLGSVRQTR